MTHQDPSILTITTWAIFDCLEAALYRAASASQNIVNGELLPSSVLNSMNGMDLSTPFGRIKFDPNGVNSILRGVAAQVLPSSSTAEIIYPTDIQTASFVYPMPTWDERVYQWKLVRGSSEIAAMAIAFCCTILLIAIIITACFHYKGNCKIIIL